MFLKTLLFAKSGGKPMKPLLGTAMMALTIWTSGVNEAYAYLDPGAGSLFLQLLIGSIAGGLMAMKIYWAKITAFFSSHKQSSAAAKDEKS
jgi:hypothetical protein